MPGFLLHKDATILCAHGGQAKAAAPNPRVKVDGKPVVTQIAPHTISGCSFTVPPGSPMPCMMAQWVTASTRIKVGGMPVLLKDSKAICIPNGTPVNIASTQTKVKGK